MPPESTASRTRGASQIPYGDYCLYCYAPMARAREASAHCPRCEAILLRVDRESRWTLESRFVRLENAIKITVWSLGVLVIGWSMVAHLSWSLGYIVGVPIVVGFLHATASKLTARLAGVRFDLLWAVASLLFASAISVLIMALMDHYAENFSFPCLVAFPPLVLVPLLVLRLARRIERWKAHRVRTRMRSHPVELASGS